jgi:hypothetical protein
MRGSRACIDGQSMTTATKGHGSGANVTSAHRKSPCTSSAARDLQHQRFEGIINGACATKCKEESIER